MHNSIGDWSSAERLAESHEPAALNDILVSKAEAALHSGDFSQFESLLLRAQKPHVVLQGYKV